MLVNQFSDLKLIDIKDDIKKILKIKVEKIIE